MVAAAARLDPRRGEDYLGTQAYRDFLFTISSYLLHEVSHVFVTYLTKGKEDTPISIIAHVIGCSPEGGLGESGWMMEEQIFGGAVTPMRPVPTAERLRTVRPDATALAELAL